MLIYHADSEMKLDYSNDYFFLLFIAAVFLTSEFYSESLFSVTSRLPIALDLVIRRSKFRLFMSWSVGSALVILGPMVYYDSTMFGKLVIAPLNIVMYNVMTSHGPDLYGESVIVNFLIFRMRSSFFTLKKL